MATVNMLPYPPVAAQVAVGDVIFIRVPARPFREVASATGSWTNHVGIVVSTAGREPMVAESTFPLSRLTPLSRFIARSEHRRVAICRLRQPLDAGQRERLRTAALQRLRILYDSGFNLHSGRQFCSRFVREVVNEATGIRLGEVQDFAALLRERPDANLGFWQLWFFGRIPWNRQTVSPASVLRSPELLPVIDGYSVPCPA
jgi:hypothetical protein